MAEIANGCFFMRFVATLPLVTASFSLGPHIMAADPWRPHQGKKGKKGYAT